MRLASIAVALGLASASTCAQAQESAPFYRGKTIRIVISTGVAGGYDEYARVIAEHMGRAHRWHSRLHCAEHAGRWRAAGCKLSLHSGAAGRHHHWDRAFERAAGAALGQQGRALRYA